MSSGITGFYDEKTRTLTVTFRNGTYKCVGVHPVLAEGFLTASSKGRYWNSRLKGRY